MLQHLAPEAKRISDEITEKSEHIQELEGQLVPYDRMLSLIDGASDILEDAVAQVFEETGDGLRVELAHGTEKGATLDMFVYGPTGCSLAIEVTGVKGKLDKSDPHWADFLAYLPEHNSKNADARIERIVLVVNTQRETQIENRDRSSDVTSPVRLTVEDNHICVIRSVDLYNLWRRTQEEDPKPRIFDILFETEGLYEPEVAG